MSHRLASTALKLRSPVAQLGKRLSSGHGEYRHFPFNDKVAETHPVRFGVKYAAFVGTGFSIPFCAIYYRWHREGGIKHRKMEDRPATP